jgi:hypothetical protein
MDGIDGSFGAISHARRPETTLDVEGQPGRGGDKIINGSILRMDRIDVI